ncbi:MAG: DUF4251 domain-containing protein [Bacteroidales bacterium]|nr:DUF4251 domain-containing protein [Bacteroidales bacterium]
MKQFLLIPIFFMLCTGIMAQDTLSQKEVKKEASVKKKQRKEAEAERKFKEAGQLLETRHFILQAKFIKNREGSRISVNPLLNFIQIDSNQAFLQIGFYQFVGPNQAGGISADGRITRWKLEKSDKRKTYTLFMSVITNRGNIDIFMDINQNSYATATLSGITSARLTYDGDLLPTDKSDVHKGWTP